MAKSKLGIKYGWRPDTPDPRDLKYKVKSKSISIPDYVDLRPGCSPIEDQGSLGSCTAQAIAGMIEYLEKKEGKPFDNLSRLFVYYNERRLEGTVNEDSGAMLRSGIKTLNIYGHCSESLWPYDIYKFSDKPSMCCYLMAKKERSLVYERLSTLDDMLMCLASGNPFVFGISIFESFETEDVSRTGIVPMPHPDEAFLGGHAVCAVGYDKARRVFIVRNSWGEQWGDKGFFYLPFDYATSLGDDFWVVYR